MWSKELLEFYQTFKNSVNFGRKMVSNYLSSISDVLNKISLEHRTNPKQKPYVTTVHGLGPNSGKTWFCEIAREHLHHPRKFDVYCSANPHLEELSLRQIASLEYLFLEVAVNSLDIGDTFQREIFMRETKLKRNCSDHSLVIYNPQFVQPNLSTLKQLFDSIVENPYSRKK